MKSTNSPLILRVALAIAAIPFALAMCGQAQTFTTLITFNGKNGGEAYYYGSGALMQGLDGNLYGSASGGGVSSDTGTVFKVAMGKLTTLYEFCAHSGCPAGRMARRPAQPWFRRQTATFMEPLILEGLPTTARSFRLRPPAN